MNTTDQLPEPELGYIKTDISNQPAFSARQMREAMKHVSKSGQVLRWAVLTTRSGFSVAGKPSCSASSANDNQEIGEKIAIDNARQELWPLMGYALKERMASSDA